MTDVDVPEIDDMLARLVEVIDTMYPPPSEGPGVILTLSGLVISGRVIAPRQWFEEVEHASRAGFTVHTGGAIDDEHGGWATLFTTVSESLTRDHDEHAAAQDALGSLPERYRQRLLPLDPTHFIHLRDARVFAPSGAGLPGGGMHWRGRLCEVSGWSFGLLDVTPPAAGIDHSGHRG